MLADQMKSVVETFSEKILQENPFSVAASQGQVTQKQLAVYLNNLRWIFKNNSHFIKKAKQRAASQGKLNLALFLESKYHEEIGHDKWAEDDLKLCEAGTLPSDEQILPSAHKLMDFLDQIITKDPTLIVSYILFAEYFTVIVGPRFLDNLESKCGILKTSVSAISKHVEADQAHAAENLRVVGQFVESPDLADSMMSSLYDSISLTNSFLAECVQNAL